ncbi:MAG TPA: glycosyltransferase family 87 protein [Thermoleophilaceae bacterium]|nr:glycosyltransferase family 87 protein [Thermoleophilaceae bacterium]
MELRALATAALAALALAAPPAQAAELERPPQDDVAPAGFTMTADEATAVARRDEKVRAARRVNTGPGPLFTSRLRPTAYIRSPGRWQVSWFVGDDEVVQVHVDDRTGAILESWDGDQVAWRMARGYEGAFGRKWNSPWLLVPLGLLFLLPFVDVRRPLRLLHLDLLVLLGFGVSHVFFNRGEIGLSVPLVYPVLLYLGARMLWEGRRRRERDGALVPHVPLGAMAFGVIFLAGFRAGLNILDSNVIDVGYSGVIGADRIADGEPLYEGEFAPDNQSGNVYGPVAYLAYLPFEQLLPWSGSWDDLPAAHAAAIAFDLLTLAGLYVLGVRLRSRALGVALAYAWATFPYSLFALSTNSNDTLVAALLVWALVGAASPVARGALLAFASAAKFAPLALVPLFARLGRPLRFAVAFLLVTAAAVLPFLPDGGLRDLYDTTLGFHAGRESPFSVWGQEDGLDWLHAIVKVAVAALAVAVAVFPRDRDVVQTAALGAAALIALQLAAVHWFYLYVVWFTPFVLAALFAAHRDAGRRVPA